MEGKRHIPRQQQHEQTAVDQGYAWVIVVCSFILQGTSCGISFSVGVFFVEWLDVFDEPHDVTAWVGSLNTGLMFGGGPLASILIKRYGHRTVCMSGCLLAATGLLLASYAKTLPYLFLCYGLIAGIGICFMYIPASVVCSTYFNKYRPLALAIACSGTGLFCLMLPPLLRLAITLHGWRGAMVFLSALCVQSCLFACLLFPVEFWDRKRPSQEPISIVPEKIKEEILLLQSDNKKFEFEKNSKSLREQIIVKLRTFITNLCSLIDFKLLIDIKFTIFSINNILWNASALIVIVMITDYAVSSCGISKDKGALLVSITGLSSFCGRIVSGIIVNYFQSRFSSMKGFWVYNIATAISAIAVALLPLSHSYVFLCAICGLFGLCFGAQIGVLAVTIIDLFGIDKLSIAYGYLMVSHALGSMSGPPVAGMLREYFQAYDIPFYFGGGISLFSALFACIIPLIDSRKQYKIVIDKDVGPETDSTTETNDIV